MAGYYIDDDGDPIEIDDVPEDDYADHLPDFWTGPSSGTYVIGSAHGEGSEGSSTS